MSLDIDAGRALLVIVLTIIGVVVINVVIYYAVSKGGTIGQINLMREAARRARNPWRPEDEMLEELSQLVAGLKKEPADRESQTDIEQASPPPADAPNAGPPQARD
jgi:hypothetical protein